MISNLIERWPRASLVAVAIVSIVLVLALMNLSDYYSDRVSYYMNDDDCVIKMTEYHKSLKVTREQLECYPIED